VESRIEQVTIYARGAAVRRIATATAPATVRIAGLPLALIDDSVRVEVDGGPVAATVRVGTDAEAEPEAEESPELRAARRREALATAEVVRLETALDRLAHAPVIAGAETDEPPPAWSAVVAARTQLIEVRAAREQALREALAAGRRELDEAHRTHEVIATREALKGTAKGPKLHEVRTYVELELTGTGTATIHLEYQVAAARWAPSYVARLDGTEARLELRAIVAQDSGEDWKGVALRLSTAEPTRFAPLPELAPQRIGRRQQEPARRGFRAPPRGAEQLYGDYDRSFPRAQPRTFGAALDDSTYEGRAPTAAEEDLAAQVWDEDSSHAKGVYPAGPPRPEASKKRSRAGGVAPPASQTAFAARAYAPPLSAGGGGPPPGAFPEGEITRVRGGIAHDELRRESAADARRLESPANARRAEGAAYARRAESAAEAATAEPQPRLDYGNLVMAPASSGDRGRLVPLPRSAASEAPSRVDQLALPPGHVDEWAHSYDYAFASDGVVDVASDGAWHSVALTARAATAKVRHVAVPREQQDVFRVAEIENPFEGPLLPGPIDVYDRGQFLVTSEVDYTAPRGRVEVGLGVDPAVKIARNAEFHEEAAGMLRGTLRLVHAIAIEIDNTSQRAVDVEVRERVPVTREGDDEIEVTVGRVDPAWEPWAPEPASPGARRLRGGHRWRVSVAPAAKKLLRAAYDVRIPAKTELVGGNRREP
jgi:hypothetical protein